MDAVKFMEEYNRMCRSYGGENCDKCPLVVSYCFDSSTPPKEKKRYSDIVGIVEKWSEENPKKYTGKKFIIEIDRTMGENTFGVKNTELVVSRMTLDKLEEYKEDH